MKGPALSGQGVVFGTLLMAVTAALAGCTDIGGILDPTSRPEPAGLGDLTCSIPESWIFSGGPGKDGIPALTNPTLVGADAAGAAYLRDSDRVVGMRIEGETIAIPLNIFWWHEIVNLDIADRHLAITHCPLTGSSLGFDRSVVDGAEFGVSGLLYLNNLLMYDRTTQESLWPQMLRGARCGHRDGTELRMVPVLEATWEGWRDLHPGTLVVSSNTGHQRDYRVYPYADYDHLDNTQLLFPIPEFDTTRPPKERVLGIVLGSAAIGFPFGLLEDAGEFAAIDTAVGGTDVVVFWDGVRRAAMAFDPAVDGDRLTFSGGPDGIVDQETGTTWRVDGVGVEGELAGHRLRPLAEAFISFWFAWRVFYPAAETWRGS